MKDQMSPDWFGRKANLEMRRSHTNLLGVQPGHHLDTQLTPGLHAAVFNTAQRGAEVFIQHSTAARQPERQAIVPRTEALGIQLGEIPHQRGGRPGRQQTAQRVTWVLPVARAQ